MTSAAGQSLNYMYSNTAVLSTRASVYYWSDECVRGINISLMGQLLLCMSLQLSVFPSLPLCLNAVGLAPELRVQPRGILLLFLPLKRKEDSKKFVLIKVRFPFSLHYHD